MQQAPAVLTDRRLQRRRWVLHAALILLGWLLFAWSWHRVTAAGPEIGELRWLLLTAVLVVPVLTLSWVAHNVGIHRRKGPRRSVTPVTPRHEVDFNGRRIEADWSALGTARRIVIIVDGDRKRFVAAASPAGAPSAAPAPAAAPACREPA